ncbi:MAG TPA: DUF87 domain-containing protein [Acidimicrobiia bacterium]|nr:DUF87 domain-containing protein [Acidimicrobiia bacterium]
MNTKPGDLYLGALIEQGGERGAPLLYEAAGLTTHGVIVGMTGSGKTGLAVGLLEEALLSGIPCLIIDPKGDMTNLLLNFPNLAPTDFEPWVDGATARREGIDKSELAAKTASLWKDGLASWEIGSERMRQLESRARLVVYTPGSTAGVPINVLGSLAAPDTSDPEALRDEIEGFVSSLLVLAGVESDPISGAEHILLATIIETAWSQGEDLDLATLIGSIQQPQFRRLGVFEVDAFIPAKQRTALAMKLNGLVASPSFAAWREGEPLDIGRILFDGEATQGSIFYLAHLSDTERQFFVTLLLSKVVTYLRTQSSGSSDLRTLIYMDEIAGFCPPTSEPPSKKPILTIAKQARAFGFGMVLTTQNPMDFDYKVMSNAGTWAIGRLQTERDKARILEGMQSAAGEVDMKVLDQQISGLDKRQFVLHTTGGTAPRLFTTRWVMSYLAGPLTKDQVATLAMADRRSPAEEVALDQSVPVEVPEEAPPLEPSSPPKAVPDDVVPLAPMIAPGVTVCFLDLNAPWAVVVGAGGASELAAMVAATVNLLYDDTPAKLEHRETYEAILTELGHPLTSSNVISVDHDPRDFLDAITTGAQFVLPPGGIDKLPFWKKLSSELTEYLVASRRISIWKNSGLKLYSRVGESESEFRARCISAAEGEAEKAIAALRDKYKLRIERARDAVAAARRRASDLAADVGARKQEEVMSGAGDLLGALLGGRSRSAVSRAATRRSQTKRTEARLDTAEDAVTAKIEALNDLEADLAHDILEIDAEFDDKAASIDEVEIPLEKVDVKVTDLKLVWVPVA